MTEHLSQVTINALADGELSADQLAIANDHLAVCPACTSTALVQTLLKTNVARTAQRYAVPPGLEQRLKLLASRDASRTAQTSRPVRRSALAGWAVAALLLLVFSGTIGLLHRGRQAEVASAAQSAQTVRPNETGNAKSLRKDASRARSAWPRFDGTVDESWPSSYIFADRLRSQNRSWGQAFRDNGRRAVLKKAGRAVDGFLPGRRPPDPQRNSARNGVPSREFCASNNSRKTPHPADLGA